MIGFIAAICGGRIEGVFLCAAGVQRKWVIAICGGMAAGIAAGIAAGMAAEWRQEGSLRPSRPRRDGRAQEIAALRGRNGGGFLLQASGSAAGRRLVVSKALAQQKGLAIKKAALLFTKPDGRIRNIILFPPSRREILKDRAERTGMSA